jgi:DNA-binding PadR family transcriptional regulator
MRSPANWALLGLIIEQPGYAYELARRFRERYATLLTLEPRHVYGALSALSERGLIEEVPDTRREGQPGPHYRATQAGRDGYREWLISHVAEDRRQHELFVLQLAPLAGDAERLLELIEDCEHEWLRESMATAISRHAAGDAEAEGDLTETLARRLIAEERRLAVGAKLSWLEWMRVELRPLLRSRPRRVR